MKIYNDFFYQAVCDLMDSLGVNMGELSVQLGYHEAYVRTRVSADPNQPLARRMHLSLRELAKANGLDLELKHYLELKRKGYKVEWIVSETTGRKKGLHWTHNWLPAKSISVVKEAAAPITMVHPENKHVSDTSIEDRLKAYIDSKYQVLNMDKGEGALTTEIINPKEENEPTKFPALYKGRSEEQVVLMMGIEADGLGVGIVVHASDYYNVGHFSNAWEMGGLELMPEGASVVITQS